MTIATAWAALAKQENAAYRKKWGTGLQQQKREQPKPKQKGRPYGTYNPERLALIGEMIVKVSAQWILPRSLGYPRAVCATGKPNTS